jgi:ABC-type transport system involved in multi-copper enzyme maturation permease subunit
MSRPIVAQLIRKDLFLVRWMIAGSILAGAVSLAILPWGRVASYVGGVSFICTLIVLNIFLVMTAVAQEQKDKTLLFVLSLPISTTEYVVSKALATVTAFAAPWLVLTVAAIVVIDVSSVPNGIVPFWVALLAYLLFYHCALIAVALVTDSTGWHATAITVGNISVNFLIPFLLSRPSIVAHADSPTAVWTADIAALAGLEIVAGAAVLCLAVYLRSRRTDFI